MPSGITSGRRLGPYEIVTRLGAGGMGEVFRARDTRLDRSVAIKVLPTEFAESAQLKARFEREAKAISQLNHPHICTLHDIGESEGVNFLVMELLEGETLAARLDRGPLTLPEVLRYGAQIASALDRAHRAGIVHRDLKPGNIMLTRSGAKLLDFGLAKHGPRSAFEAMVSQNAPTEEHPTTPRATKPLTEEGTILGTFQYMAPEQLEGTDADARTDIFALGAVLYEMATGKRAFDGKTKTSLIAAIVGGEPKPLREVLPLTPPAFEHVVTKCLTKEPDERWQSAHDVAEELRWIETSAATTAPASTRWQRLALPLLALLAIAAAVMTVLYVRERSRGPEPLVFNIPEPEGGSFSDAAISPDGRRIAFFTGDRGKVNLWVQSIDQADPVRIADKSFQTGSLTWSPDGESLAYFDSDKLLRVSVSGGKPEIVVRKTNYGVGLAWSSNGTILFCPAFDYGLFQVPASGGEPVAVTRLDASRNETVHAWPHFIDDQRFLYLVRTLGEERNEIYAGSLDGKLRKAMVKADALVGVSQGHLLFVRDGAMYAQRFDSGDLTLGGEPAKILDDILYFESNAVAGADVSPAGPIVYARSSLTVPRWDFAWTDRKGERGPITFSERGVDQVRISRDERRIAYTSFDSKKGAKDVHVLDLERSISTRVTSGLSDHDELTWSPTGTSVLFSSDRTRMYDIYEQTDDGTSPARPIWTGTEDKFPHDVSPDGKILLATLYASKTGNDIWAVPLEKPADRRPLVVTEGHDRSPRFSPDGKWITYLSVVSGRYEVFVRPYPDGRAIQVSVSGGHGPEWSADGREIYYSNDDTLFAVPVQFDGGVARLGKPASLFQIRDGDWWASPKTPGRFLVGHVVRPKASPLVYDTAWLQKLR